MDKRFSANEKRFKKEDMVTFKKLRLVKMMIAQLVA